MTDLPLTKISETTKTITLGWTPVACEGYEFLAGGVRVSNSWNSAQSQVRFSKVASGKYAVRALGVSAEGLYPPVAPPPPPGYPASYFTGPLGAANFVPKKPGAFLIENWGQPGKQWSDAQAAIAARETFIGRKFDSIHIQYWAGGSYLGVAGIDGADVNRHAEQWVHDRGQFPVITWAPPMTIDQVNQGAADQVFGVAADLWKAMPFTIMLRPFWEFDNDAGFPWSCGHTASIGAPFVAAWQRMVNIFKQHGANNVGFFWNPLEGGDRAGVNQSYPGDAYVDWVGSDIYNGGDGNWNTPLHQGWASFQECALYPNPPGASQYSLWSPKKPFVAGEVGCTPDARKGDWFRAIPAALKTAPNYCGISFFDQDVSGLEGPTANWFVDTSTDSYAGFKQMALDPWLNTGT